MQELYKIVQINGKLILVDEESENTFFDLCDASRDLEGKLALRKGEERYLVSMNQAEMKEVEEYFRKSGISRSKIYRGSKSREDRIEQ